MKKQIIKAVASLNEDYGNGRYYKLMAKFYDQEYSISYVDILFFSKLARKYGDPILELGCGTGRIALPLAELGFEVWGLDVSDEMLNEFRRKIESHERKEELKIKLIKKNMKKFELEKKFNLIFSAGNTFLHLLTKDAQIRTLKCISRHLSDNGVVVIDIFNPTPEKLEGSNLYRMNAFPVFYKGEKYLVYSQSKHLSKKKMIIVEKRYVKILEGMEGEELRVSFQLRYIYKHELDNLMNSANLEPVEVYGDYLGNPYDSNSERIIYVAKKKISHTDKIPYVMVFNTVRSPL